MLTQVLNFIGPTPSKIRIDKGRVTREVTILGGLIPLGVSNFPIVGKAVDWHNVRNFDSRLEEDSELGINCYADYSGPGIGKPNFSPNSKGVSYHPFPKRNMKHFEECDRRLAEMRRKGVSAICGFGFADTGIANWNHNSLRSETAWLAKHYKGKSVMRLAMSEYDEMGSTARAVGLSLVNAHRKVSRDPVSLHSVNQMREYRDDIKHCDFICHQGWNERMIQQHSVYKKPIFVIEDQGVKHKPNEKIARFNRARHLAKGYHLDIVYFFTGNSYGWSDEEKIFLRSIQQ